jgi:hypothetical protein
VHRRSKDARNVRFWSDKFTPFGFCCSCAPVVDGRVHCAVVVAWC